MEGGQPQEPQEQPTLDETLDALHARGVPKDRFTYLVLLEHHVREPGALESLNQKLQDEKLTQDIGWDLVEMLIPLEGCESCLETVARLGNPKEVYLKVTQVLGDISKAWSTDVRDGPPGDNVFYVRGSEYRGADRGADDSQELWSLPKEKIPGAFITLLGMLAVLHQRLRARYPSQFLGPALACTLRAYRPTPEMTAAVINLVRSLSGRKRPPLPARTSSISVPNPANDGDTSKNAPDPEAQQEEPMEDVKQRELLQAFVSWILQEYVDAHDMRWSARLVESYNLKRTIPGKKTIIDSYREEEDLQTRDAVVGQLVALLWDLGLDKCPEPFVASMYESSDDPDPNPSGDSPAEMWREFTSASPNMPPSQLGMVCLLAYWMFSAEVFAAPQPRPEMYIFPHHLRLLQMFADENPQQEVSKHKGVADALLTIGLVLKHRNLITAGDEPNVMAYHHHLSLILVFHPDIQVRNAATVFAGSIFHEEPEDEKRFEIMEDLFVNCDYPSLKACAVQWLKEEIITARGSGVSNRFTSPESIDRLQSYIFPDLRFLSEEQNPQAVLEYWALNGVFLLQAVNFAYFLFAEPQQDVVPTGMANAVERRFADPLINATGKVQAGRGWDEAKTTFKFAIDRLCDVHFQ
ncbi:hypothetical protein DL765_010595 [Monosporascus sp. GIB2]|nr:hypothetical protein DL765_010595 [Monosporascus sp. GIB2]